MITNNLSTLMGSKRVRIAEIARITGLTNDTISKIYNDKTKGIDFKTLDKLCWALECTPNDIFPYTPDA
ncbi:TPA: helix-turn-helix transcriptional regulator [Candidatus Spyradomonas excrementavium]|nr:helix-turn-helix transcriptional regulator [Candidatus Spyradomonas excrementavium]